MSENIEYTIVIPVYNGEKTLNELYIRLKKILSEITEKYEIIYVDDCSQDNSWKILQELHAVDKRNKAIHFIRNFGQHNATLCGFYYAQGNYVITLDDDLQHPPEEIPKLIKKAQEGFFVVYGRYIPQNARLFENFLSRIFQRLIHRILQIPDAIFLSSFAIYKKEVIKNMILIKSSYPFLFGLMMKSTSINRISNVDVDHVQRKAGESNYNLIKYFKYSLNLIFNYSSWPLLFVAFLGLIVSIFSLSFGFWIIIQKMLDPGYGIMGWNSLMVAISFLGGVILISMGIIGEYLRRILTETSHGQQYVIAEMEL
jgi:polyisoprenyl-phosphate glycosyltransferase